MKGRKAIVANRKRSNVGFILFSLMMIVCGLPSMVSAQAGPHILSEPPVDVAPPPLKVISPADRKMLDGENNLKKRTQISLQLMESKLLSAEKFNAEDNYTQSLDNLSGFQAVLENTFVYLEKNDANNKADSRFKQLEIFLRKQVPRLETLRRLMPYKYGYYVLKLMKVVRETRAKAVRTAFFPIQSLKRILKHQMQFLNSPPQNFFYRFLLFSFCALTIFMSFSTAFAQKRDNMTDEEDMKVRDAQEIDLRMQVYSKIISRRLSAINNPNAADSKDSQKDVNNDWGAIRTGTSAELFWDIQKTLDESISKIDDIGERDQKNPLFGKAVHILADNCKNWIPQFKTYGEKASTDQERNSIINSINSCNDVVEASAKVSREVPKEAKDKKKKTE